MSETGCEYGVKMPRNIAHWARLRGLVVEFMDDNCIYLRSRRKEFTRRAISPTRHFRLLGSANEFQICDGNFDRWANSVGASVPIPLSRSQFDAALDELVASAKMPGLTEEAIKAEAERSISSASETISYLVARYGAVKAWSDAHGSHGKAVRRDLARFERGLARQLASIRMARRHCKAKMAELVVRASAAE